MSYCFNPSCPKPQNPQGLKFCITCRTKLLLTDRYRALQPIGHGGMGRTFLAVDELRLGASCVIKQLLPASEIQNNSEAMAKAIQLFEQEARQLPQLGEHPQIPALLAYFEQEKRLYLVQQLIEGQDLSQELEKHGAFSEKQIRELLMDLLPVLQFIHEHQVIHRDIKPMNILRREKDGKLVLIDFGISKQVNATSEMAAGTRAGTEGYAPIEQIRGGKAYPASDLYSLAVTCIHLLTKTTPDDLFDPIASRWVWRSHLQDMGSDVSEQLSQVLEKMLKDSVQERYQAAEDAIAAIDSDRAVVQKAKPVSAGSTHTPVPAFKPTAPAPATVTPVSTSPPPHNSPWQCVHTLTGHSDSVRSIAFSPDGKILASGSSDKTIKLWQLEAKGRSPVSPLQSLTGHSGSIGSVAFSPDGKILASGSADKTVKLWQVAAGLLFRTLTGHSGLVSSVAIAPDGQTLASGSDDKTIQLWHLGTGQRQFQLIGHSGGVKTIAIAPDGKILASGSADKTIDLWNLETGNLLQAIAAHSDLVYSLTFSPDSQTFASSSRDKTIQRWQVAEGARLGIPKEHPNGFYSVAIAPDGETLASGCEDNTIKIWHLETGKLLQTLKGHSGEIWSVAFSPDGRTLATASADKTIKIWRSP